MANNKETIRIWCPLWGDVRGGGWQKRDVMGCWQVLRMSSLYFFIKENWISAEPNDFRWPDAEPNVNVLLTKSLPFDSDVREWSHLLMIPLYCFWVYQTIERLVNLNVMWLWLLKVRSGNISELILKTKADLKDGSDNSSHP